MAAVLLVGGVVVLVTALAYGRQAARDSFDRLLLGAAGNIAASITVRDGAVLVDIPMATFDLLALAPDDRIRYRVIGPNNSTLTGSDAASLPRESGETVLYDGTMGAEPARFVALTRRFAERSFSGSVRVIVGQTLRARRDLTRDIAQNALAVLGGAGAVMALFAWLAVRSALMPLPRIGAALARRDPTDLTPLDLSVPREVALMLSPLNDVMARLDRQV
ncbi:MAG: sensor histidine kinase, partial [Rhodobacterales bacterium]|nr:sensor histidine kinase [Rhodobacterales bacterium]